jgi:DnaJ-domain-containing protein 1
MGQLFNRVIRFTKSYFINTDVNINNMSHNNDDENLNKIFEELKNDSFSTHNRNSQNNIIQDKSFDSDFNNACNILSITSDASIDDIKSAYLKLLKKYHPDKVETLDEEIRILAEKKTKEINLAYDLIRKTKGFN